MATYIKNLGKEILGKSKGKQHSSRGTCWWNDEVQAATKAKKSSFKI